MSTSLLPDTSVLNRSMARTPIQAPVASSSSGSESESEQEEQQAVKKRRVQFLDVAQQEER